jgi:hypothetical protein
MQPYGYDIDEEKANYRPIQLNDGRNTHFSQLYSQAQEYRHTNVDDLLDRDISRLRPLENAEKSAPFFRQISYLAISRNYGNAEYKCTR